MKYPQMIPPGILFKHERIGAVTYAFYEPGSGREVGRLSGIVHETALQIVQDLSMEKLDAIYRQLYSVIEVGLETHRLKEEEFDALERFVGVTGDWGKMVSACLVMASVIRYNRIDGHEEIGGIISPLIGCVRPD